MDLSNKDSDHILGAINRIESMEDSEALELTTSDEDESLASRPDEKKEKETMDLKDLKIDKNDPLASLRELKERFSQDENGSEVAEFLSQHISSMETATTLEVQEGEVDENQLKLAEERIGELSEQLNTLATQNGELKETLTKQSELMEKQAETVKELLEDKHVAERKAHFARLETKLSAFAHDGQLEILRKLASHPVSEEVVETFTDEEGNEQTKTVMELFTDSILATPEYARPKALEQDSETSHKATKTSDLDKIEHQLSGYGDGLRKNRRDLSEAEIVKMIEDKRATLKSPE